MGKADGGKTMRRLYEDHAYDPAWPRSWWRDSVPTGPKASPLDRDLRVEVAVIGAGYAGLNAALELSRQGVDSVVLDAVQPGWGASGRNGGFCCIGGTKLSAAQVIARTGAEGARDLRRWQVAAIGHVAATLAEHDIPARQGPDGEAYLAHRPDVAAALQDGAEADARLYGEPAEEVLSASALAERGLAGPGFYGAVIGRHGFPLHPMIYVEGLSRAATKAGVRIHGDTPVQDLRRDGDRWRLSTPGGTVSAAKVLIATNGYSSEDIPGWLAGRTLPAISSILVTRPLSEDERLAQGFTSPLMSCDQRKLLHYFRHLPDGRFMFGMRGGTSASAGAEARTFSRVRVHFEALFPAWRHIETTHSWGGFVCLTGSLAPFVGEVPEHPGLFAALGWHGGGVGPASYAGKNIGRQIAGQTGDIPPLFRMPPRRFPFAPFRRIGLQLAYMGYNRKDGPLPAVPVSGRP